MVSIEGEITCSHLEQHICKNGTFRTGSSNDEVEVSSLLLFVTESEAEPLTVSIAKEKLYLEQGKDPFCHNYVSSLNRENKLLSLVTLMKFSSDLPPAMSNS